MPSNNQPVVAQVEQLVRKPVQMVFSAFVEPGSLTQFWLAHASGPLALGKKLRWDFKVRGVSDELEVIGWDENQRIKVRWSDQTTTEWTFSAAAPGGTLVRIEHSGFAGETDEIIASALEATQGYTIVLCDLKVLLEHGIVSNLVGDKAAIIEESLAAAKREESH